MVHEKQIDPLRKVSAADRDAFATSRTPTVHRPGTTRTIALLVMLALFAPACATTRPEIEWVKLRESAEDFTPADEDCQKRAMAGTADQYIQSTATKAALGIYLSCMKEKGWTQRRQPTPASTP